MKNKKIIYIGVGLVTAALAGTLIFGQLSSDDSAGKLRSTVKPATTSIKVKPSPSVPSMQVAPATNNSSSSAPTESNSSSESDRLACLDGCSDSYNSCLGDDTSGLSTEAFNAVESGCSSEQSACRSDCNG